MLRTFLSAMLLAMLLTAGTFCQTTQAAEKIKVLIVDGQNNHNWRSTTPVMKKTLESAGLFTVDVSTSPGGRDLSKWNPEFSKYGVVVSNYNGAA